MKETCGTKLGVICKYVSSAKFVKGNLTPYWKCNKYNIKLVDKDNWLQKCLKCKKQGEIE